MHSVQTNGTQHDNMSKPTNFMEAAYEFATIVKVWNENCENSSTIETELHRLWKSERHFQKFCQIRLKTLETMKQATKKENISQLGHQIRFYGWI